MLCSSVAYREHAKRIAARDRDDDPAQSLISYDASGRRGRGGRRGRAGADGNLSGADGQRGDDGGPAERGRDGGSVRLELERGDRDSVA